MSVGSVEEAVRAAIHRDMYPAEDVDRIFDAVKAPRRRRRALGIKFPTSYAVTYKRWIASYMDDLLAVAETWLENSLKPTYARHQLGFEDSAECESVEAFKVTASRDGIEDIQAEIAGLLGRFGSVMGVEAIQTYVNSLSNKVLEYSNNSWRRSIHTLTKVDPLIRNAPLRRIMDAHTQANVALIKTIPVRLHGEIERVVWENARQGKLTSNLVEDLNGVITKMKPGEPTRSRQAPNPELIAIDQLGKFAGDLAKEHFSQAGQTTFVWRNMQDRRVRGNPSGKYPNAKFNHWEREGRVYAWDEPPEDGIPGFSYRCRCFAAINEDELLEKEGAAQPGQQYDPPVKATPKAPKEEVSPNTFGRWYRRNHTDLSQSSSGTTLNGAQTIEQLYDDALHLELPFKAITDVAAQAAQGSSYYGPHGTEWLKTMKSLTEKVVERGNPLKTLTDSIRSTISVEKTGNISQATKEVLAGIKRAGGKVLEVSDLYAVPRAEGYVGLHVNFALKTPEGNWVRAEIQIHTVADLKVKESAHQIYQQIRLSGDSVAEELVRESVRIYEPVYQSLMGGV